MPGRKPRVNWIYMIDPKIVVLRCRNGHNNAYDISGALELNCSHPSCNRKINSSSVMRGQHPHIIYLVRILLRQIPYLSRHTID